MNTDPHAVRQAINAAWKIEAPRLVAALVRLVRDVSLAEDLAQDALVAALEHWPQTGIPEKPGAWLMTTAKRRALDRLRSERLHDDKHVQLAEELAAREEDRAPEFAVNLDDNIGDDLLRLMFIACHPMLSTESRIALTLKLLGGLTTAEIARAYLVPEPTIAQRIVRAKRALAHGKAPFEEPDEDIVRERLGSVLEVIYLIFNEGYAATRGDDWLRPALCDDALRLARVLVELVPEASEAHALLALMELHASRFHARTGEDGELVLLENQNRALWDRLLIRRGLHALESARRHATEPGIYLLQAEIAACHARATSVAETDWQRIAMLYGVLAQRNPSPVIELNRAVAVCMAFGAETALALLEPLRDEPAMMNYHLLPSVRGDFLFRLGRFAEAGLEFRRAATLAGNARERDFLEARAQSCENR